MSNSNTTESAIPLNDLIKAYISGICYAVKFVQNKVVPILNGQINLSKREEAIRNTFFRIHALCSSQTRLNHPMDFNAVANNCRTIFELLLDLKLFSAGASSDENIKKFHAFSKINRFRAAKKLIDFRIDNPNVISEAFTDNEILENCISNTDESELERQVYELWGKTKKGKPNWPTHWSGMSVRDRTKEYGAVYEQEYLEIYWMLSNNVHSGSAAYEGLTNDAIEAFYRVCLDISRKMYLESLLICSAKFHFRESIKDFSKITEYIREAPTKILTRHVLNNISKLNSDKIKE